ncbi:MAG: hypothetical protein RL095_2439 [Verrucomicrobiota bacterium]|jgi:hypothetical protein
MSLILTAFLALAGAPEAGGAETGQAATDAPKTRKNRDAVRSAPSDALVRRLYLDLFNRVPELEEFGQAVRMIDTGGYAELVDLMMKSQEYQLNLAAKVVNHYAPPLKDRNHGLVDYKRLETHLKDRYLKPGGDFRVFLEDMLKARGLAISNPLVLFYSDKESVPVITSRFTERVMGVPMGCAECHDHRVHPDIKITDFWQLAAFYQGFEKTYIANEEKLDSLERKLGEKDRDGRPKLAALLGQPEYKRILSWIEAEKKGVSIYDELSDKDKLGVDPSNRVATVEEARMKKMAGRDEATLLAPQLYLYEDKVRLSKIEITYPVKGVMHSAKARLFRDERGIDETRQPRDMLAKWMATQQGRYVSRAVANWVGNWLYGRALALPVNDVYDTRNATLQIAAFADLLEKERWDINALVRGIVLSPAYRMPSSPESDEEKFMAFKARRLRHLSGEQLVNSLNGAYLSRLRRDGSVGAMRQLYLAELDRNEMVQSLFPASLGDSEASYRGTLNQTLFLSSNKRMLDFAHKLAQAGYNARQGSSHEAWIDSIFVRFYSRHCSPEELAFFDAKLDAGKSYEQSGFFEAVWALLNSPEMRLY